MGRGRVRREQTAAAPACTKSTCHTQPLAQRRLGPTAPSQPSGLGLPHDNSHPSHPASLQAPPTTTPPPHHHHPQASPP